MVLFSVYSNADVPSLCYIFFIPGMETYGNQNQIVLEVTVVGCSKLKNTNCFRKQDPYVLLHYVGVEFQTTPHKGGGINPTYNQKYYFRLIEDVDQLDVRVCTRNIVMPDTSIGSGRVYLQRVLSMGRDETAWPIVDKRNKFAGEVKLSMVKLEAEKNLQLQVAPRGTASFDNFLENVGLFIFRKATEYLGLNPCSRY